MDPDFSPSRFPLRSRSASQKRLSADVIVDESENPQNKKQCTESLKENCPNITQQPIKDRKITSLPRAASSPLKVLNTRVPLERSQSFYAPKPPFFQLPNPLPEVLSPNTSLHRRSEHQPKLPLYTCCSHTGINAISVETFSSLLETGIQGKYKALRIIDCRYEYEFLGGHILNAENWPLLEPLVESMRIQMANMDLEDGPDVCIVIHCEFSSQRGPAAYRQIREMDRNRSAYGQLHFPEMYLLEGGYKAFFNHNIKFCVPQTYVEMRNRGFLQDYKVPLPLHNSFPLGCF